MAKRSLNAEPLGVGVRAGGRRRNGPWPKGAASQRDHGRVDAVAFRSSEMDQIESRPWLISRRAHSDPTVSPQEITLGEARFDQSRRPMMYVEATPSSPQSLGPGVRAGERRSDRPRPEGAASQRHDGVDGVTLHSYPHTSNLPRPPHAPC